MGFELLEITESDFNGDEPIYDVFEITGQDTWIPKKFQQVLTSTTLNQQEPKSTQSPTEDQPEPEVPEVFFDAVESKIEPDMYYFGPEDPEDSEDQAKVSYANLELHFDRFQDDIDDPFPGHEVDAMLAHLTYDDLTSQRTVNPEYLGFKMSQNFDDRANKPFDCFAFAT